MTDDFESLEDRLNDLIVIVQENPCNMDKGVLSSFASAINGMLSSRFVRPMSRCQVARYYKVSERTIERWANQYPDFPVPRHDGHLAVSFSVDEVVKWKRNHAEIFKNTLPRPDQ